MKKLVNGNLVDLTPDEISTRQAEILAENAKIAKYEREERYKENRAKEYPPIGDQLDAIWLQLNKERTDGKSFAQDTDNMLTKILSVKSKYPKTT